MPARARSTAWAVDRVADALFVGPETIEVKLAHRELGVSRRAELNVALADRAAG